MKIDSNFRKRYFRALDIIHLWAYTRNLKIFDTGCFDIGVISETDLSNETELVCKFISLITLHTWAYRSEKNDEEYLFTFYEVDTEELNISKLSVSQISRKTGKDNVKNRKNTSGGKGKTLFD